MKNKNTAIVGLVVLVVAITAIAFSRKGKTEKPSGTSMTGNKVEESFSGSLKDAIALGVAMKCSYTISGTTYEGHIKGTKYKGTVATEGRVGSVIMVDNCMWSWDEETKQGIKTCYEFDDPEETIWDSEGADVANWDNTYTCSPTVINDEMFVPPSDIKFMNMDEMMDSMMQGDAQEFMNEFGQ